MDLHIRVRPAWGLLLVFIMLCGCGRKSVPTAAVKPIVPIAPSPPRVAAVPAVPLNPLASLRLIAKTFEYAPRVPGRVALTFDAGSDNSAVKAILAVLQEHHTRSTFFLTGKFCEEYPGSCRAIAEAGMEIGNHSYSHPEFTKRDDAAIKTQLEHAEAAIVKACGRGAKPLFRFPYGDENRRTRHAVVEDGYQPIGWTLDSLDSVGKPKSADFIAKRILAKIKPGYVTLMHVSYPHSAQALPRIFAYLEEHNMQNVPVSELLTATPPAASPAPSALPTLKTGLPPKPGL